MKEDLMVEIPKKFKRELFERVSVDSIETTQSGKFRIQGNCCLCVEYRDFCREAWGGGILCGDCPFKKWGGITKGGCGVWERMVLKTSRRTKNFFTTHERKIDLIKKVEKLRKAMDKYIKWI